jgi:site-specific recombinase XerD
LTAPNLRKLWERAREAAGLPELHWHDLRRTYGTLLVQRGASLAEARDLLGHGDVKTTSIYLASAREDLDSAVDRLPKLGGEILGKRKPARQAKKAA